MERHFHEELNELRKKILEMAATVEDMIDIAVKALVDRNEEILKEVFEKENEVNRKNIEVDDKCLKLLALYQPAAADLRLVTSAIKINSELERIGDQAVNVSQNTAKLLLYPPITGFIIIPEMADIVRQMVNWSIDAFINKDVELARKVLMRDDEVDVLKKESLKKIISLISKCDSQTEGFIDLLLISRNLEKIADHSTNISEDVIFMVQGKDIRHHNIDDHRAQ